MPTVCLLTVWATEWTNLNMSGAGVPVKWGPGWTLWTCLLVPLQCDPFCISLNMSDGRMVPVRWGPIWTSLNVSSGVGPGMWVWNLVQTWDWCYVQREGWSWSPVQMGGGCKEIPLWTEWLTGRHEWKHYLPATSLVGGKNFKQFNILPFRFSLRFTCHFASLNCTWPQLTEKIVANEAWLFTFCHSMMSMLLRTTSTLTPVNQGCIQMN